MPRSGGAERKFKGLAGRNAAMSILPSPSHAGEPPRIELSLRLADGAAWILSVSAGMERFIGFYPRLDGIRADGPLLEYRTPVRG